MLLLLLTVGFFALAMFALALGAVATGRALKGSCGGVAGSDCHCEVAGVPVEERACERLKRR